MRRGPEDARSLAALNAFFKVKDDARQNTRGYKRSQPVRALKTSVAHGHDRSAHDTASRETENEILWRGMLRVQGTMLRLPEWLDRSHQPRGRLNGELHHHLQR
jgi:hypothetical protein